MSSANTGGSVPPIGDLVNIGVDYAKSAKALIPYVAVTAASALAPFLFGQGVAGFVALLCGVAGIFLSLMAAREAMTGEFAYKDTDAMAALKLLGVGVLVVIALFVLAIPVAAFIAESRTGLLVFSLIMMAIVVAALARIAFLVPALSLGDQSPILTAIQTSIARTAPHWTTLILLLLVAALPAVLISVLFGGIGGFPGLIVQLIGAAISAFAGLVSVGAVSRFYARHVRSA